MSIKHSKEALALADKLNFIKGKGRTYREMGFANTIQDPDASLHCHQLSLQCFRLINSKRDCAFSTLYIGTHYMNRRNYREGLVYYIDALKQFKAQSDKGGVGNCYKWIARIYFLEQDRPEAIKHYYEALGIYEELKDKNNMADSYTPEEARLWKETFTAFSYEITCTILKER
ncbi:MAG: tetratricopeptide repeat protein [Segetibacter sp.]